MKKLLITAIGVFAFANVFATVLSSNTLCRIEIQSDRQETLLSIPLKTVGGTDDTIDITKYVLTQGLKAGDKLMKRTNGAWESWTLDVDDGEWVAGKTSSGDTTTTASATLDTGDVIKLYRKNPSGSFYLYGELPVDFSKPQTASKGEWTLMGNPKPVVTALEDIPAGTGDSSVQDGDKIIIAGVNTFYYNGTEKRWEKETPVASKVTIGGKEYTTVTYNRSDASKEEIPAGEGFWYIRNKNIETPLSLTWPTE